MSVADILSFCPFCVTCYWRGIYCWRVSSLNCPNRNKTFFFFSESFLLLFFPLHNHQTSCSHMTKPPGTFIAAYSVGQVTCDRWQMTGDRWHLTFDTWHMTFFSWICWYWCYYPHTLQNPLSRVCRIFKKLSSLKCLSW